MDYMNVYITGDTHGNFDRIFDFCAENETTNDDVLIILGDAGINYNLDESDYDLKSELTECPVTLFCIHGNHEQRPSEIDTYLEKEWHGGIVYYEEEYSNLLFAKDGEIYDFNGKKAIAIGGAYSVDKYYRLRNGLPWFDTEQPDYIIMNYVEKQLDNVGWQVDYVLSHAAPISCEPRWAFLPNINQDTLDKSTEKWLEEIHSRLTFDKWFAGHYHVDSQEGDVTIMFEDFDELD